MFLNVIKIKIAIFGKFLSKNKDGILFGLWSKLLNEKI